MKSEAQLQSEGRKISRAIDNYTPLHQENQEENPSQTQLNEATK